MSKSTISTFELFALIPDAESARLYLEARLWPNGAVCPSCITSKRITTRKGGFYRCNQCKLDFTVRTATIFERSHVPLHKWVYAMYLVVTARKGISLEDLEPMFDRMKQLGIEPTEHIQAATFWARVKKLLKVDPNMELFEEEDTKPCECAV